MMIENTLSLIVPSESQVRENIRRTVDCFFSRNNTIPPVSYNKLADLAEVLISQNSWDRSYKAFVMVCSGNAVWRSVVGSVPYNRRMLLLPQCLKNSTMCQGSYDELGLLCSECGNCNIAGFLQEAENLGYLTIVSEGTTIASRLVEEGNVDAIIGVGCMEVLQKMFSSVTKYSIPAIGVPLLTCGCLDTTADSSWISEEINHLDPDSGFKLLNINNLREKTNSLFTGSQVDLILQPESSLTGNILRDILLSGGKRIRPLLTVLAYESLSADPDLDIQNHLAMSVECFHKASLIHDDIEDNDTLRYGKETTHAKYGIPVAVNIGDLLIGEGYRLLTRCDLEPGIFRKCISVVAAGHKSMSTGQGNELLARRNNEILSLNEVIEIFDNKTSEAFRVSLLLGAVAASADDNTEKILDRFSHFIGIAYQLKDDLEDLSPGRNDSGIRNPSALISLLYEKATDADRLKIRKKIVEEGTVTLPDLMTKYDIADLISELVRSYVRRACDCLENLQNTQLKVALNEITGKTFREYV